MCASVSDSFYESFTDFKPGCARPTLLGARVLGRCCVWAGGRDEGGPHTSPTNSFLRQRKQNRVRNAETVRAHSGNEARQRRLCVQKRHSYFLAPHGLDSGRLVLPALGSGLLANTKQNLRTQPLCCKSRVENTKLKKQRHSNASPQRHNAPFAPTG